MEIRQLQTFIQAARFESFSKAAEMLGYSQSAVTVQIRLLEEELCCRLFDRMGRTVSLTVQGERFLEHANQILYEVNRTVNDMSADQELRNPLHIGTIESLCSAKFPGLLNRFHGKYPRVNMRITLDSPEKLIRMMEHNELDLIYILDTPRWNKDWIKVLEAAEPIVFVSSVNSEFVAGKDLKLQDILGEPFFLTEKNANYRQALDQHLALEARALKPVLEISDTEFIIKMVERNDGLSFLPYFAVEKFIAQNQLAVLDVTYINISMYRQIFYHRNKFCTREMEEFIRLVKEFEK